MAVFEASMATVPGEAPSYKSDGHDGDWLKYWENHVNEWSVGRVGGGIWYAAIRWMPEQLENYEGYAVSKIRIFINHEPNFGTAMVWQGNIHDPVLMVQQAMAVTHEDWVEVELFEPHVINTGQELWVGWEIGDKDSNNYPAASEASSQHDGLANLFQFGSNPWQFISAYDIWVIWNIEAFVTAPLVTLYTDAGGQAGFEAFHGNYVYYIQKEGYAGERGNFSLEGEDVWVDVTLFEEYSLTLVADPENGGTVTGGGNFQEGEQVNIIATPNTGWEFVDWTGDTDHVENPDSANTTVTMPAYDISLVANFEEKIIYGDGVTDIDGNEYVTVIIGDQEWMAENLRVSKYNNGDAIPTGLSNIEWENTTNGAYAIYDHNASNTDGINSYEEMVAAYGKLYNWYAVNDSRGLCPEGWHVPGDVDWTQLVNYVASQGFPNGNVTNGAGNALKSCRQVNSPLEGCNTFEHPRWNSHSTHYGFDEFGFSALPGGRRYPAGSFSHLGTRGRWWSSTEHSSPTAWGRSMVLDDGVVAPYGGNKALGFSLRCVRDATAGEESSGHGDFILEGELQAEGYTGNDGKKYHTVRIGTQVWTVENLAETKYRDGSDIPEIRDGEDWEDAGENETGARCSYTDGSRRIGYAFTNDWWLDDNEP